MEVKHYIIPVFVPHNGCPHDCVFCNQREITGQEEDSPVKELEAMIDLYLEDILKKDTNKFVEVAFFGGSFTGISHSLQEAYLKIAYKKKKEGLIDGIRLSTRPDYIDAGILEFLKEYGVTTIELGVQSLMDSVLITANRGHTISDIVRACNLIKAAGFSLGLQMMIGLPGDEGYSSFETSLKMISLKPDFVRIYPTLVIKNTELEKMYQNGYYDPFTLEEAVEITASVYKQFLMAEIPVIRIGLQPTDDLSEGSSLIAGPYHPSFRQIVESALYKEAIEDALEEIDVIDRITLYVPAKEISNVVGLNRSNLDYFEKKYSIKKIKVYPEKLKENTFKVAINDITIELSKF